MKTFDELETGTLLRFRNDQRGIHIGGTAISSRGSRKSHYGFTYECDTDWDIVGYIEPEHYTNDVRFLQKFLARKFANCEINWSWEEPVPVEKMTLRQVCEALGKEIELIPEEE